MPATVTGIYRQGKIELLETPKGVQEGRVLVTIQEESKPAPCYLTRGKYKTTTTRMSTPEDFKDAEWHGEEEFDDLYGE